ncbi:hypothetical protein D770_07180 [Flammeovirgaceae bacterium 311]|nr:hypothetical protein D770_07180 [Flammeovirgaceae bacterium 311]
MKKLFSPQLGGSSKKLTQRNEPVRMHNRREKSGIAGLLFLFAMVFVLPVQAQSNLPAATISKSGQITLDASAPLSASYQADISDLNFPTEDAAEAFLNRQVDGVTSFTLDFQNRLVIIHLAVKMLADANKHWDVNQWNKYFSEKHENSKLAGAQ